MQATLLVMLGGAIGSAARYHLGRLMFSWFGPAFPWGTLAANVLGGLLMGVLAGILTRGGDGGEPWRLLLGVGVLGGFTTFSSFSLETAVMIDRGQLGAGALYVLLSVAASIAALGLGLWTIRTVTA